VRFPALPRLEGVPGARSTLQTKPAVLAAGVAGGQMEVLQPLVKMEKQIPVVEEAVEDTHRSILGVPVLTVL
jgi:hypothetical protein